MNEMTIMAKTKARPAAVPKRHAMSDAGVRAAAPTGQSPEATARPIATPMLAPSDEAILNRPPATPAFSNGSLVIAMSTAGVAKKPSPTPNRGKPTNVTTR